MKDKLFSWIDSSVDLAIELETGLTKHPAISPDSGGDGELEKCHFLEGWLKSHGITQLERFDAPDERVKSKIRPNLIATIPSDNEDKARLWIMTHIDIVPPGELSLWESDPYTVVRKDDAPGPRLIGRGVEDDQQGLTSSVLAALAFVKQGLKPARTIKLLFAADEENGSDYGIDWLVKNHGDLFRKDDIVIVPDGGDPLGECMEIAEKNILWLKFTTKGKQTHGSLPDTGINAFLAGSHLAVLLHNALSQKFDKRDEMFNPDYSTFQPTKKENNVPNINTIPGEDIFYMDMRVLPCYSADSVLDEINTIKAVVEKNYRVKVDVEVIQKTESKPTSKDSPAVKLLESAIQEVYDLKPKTIGIGGGTMAAYLRNAGIDCVVWTKTDKTLHQPNEYALIENILGDAKVMAHLASY